MNLLAAAFIERYATGRTTALAEQYVGAPLPRRASFRAAPVRKRHRPATDRGGVMSEPPLPA